VSLTFRQYLAQREEFVIRGKKSVSALRNRRVKGHTPYLGKLVAEAKDFSKSIAAARKAARAMWRRTRDPKVRGQNEAILKADSARLKTWLAWLREVRRDPTKAFTASPVFGAWQLEFMVHNFAPALQRVVVSQQEPDGSWRELAGRHTIEFLAKAAQPRTDVRRPFSVPVTKADAVLRISIHGLGQVAIEDVVLTNGVTTMRHQGGKKRVLLGKPAPRAGFPDIAAAPDKSSILMLRF
jgi:hypothetical protein